MLIVVLHNPGLPNKLLDAIVCFAVPLFCFLSGIFFNPDASFHDYVRKRFNSLLRPYFFTLLVVSFAYVIIKSTPSLWWYLFWMIYGNGPNLPKVMLHLWFLPNLFLVTLFVWALFRYVKFMKSSIGVQLFLMTVFLVIGALGIQLFWNVKLPISITNHFMTDGNLFLINGLLNNPAYSKEVLLVDKHFVLKGLPWSLDFIMITSAFFMGGYFVSRNRLENLFDKTSIAMTMLIIFIVFHYCYNYTINLNIRRYDHMLISTAECFAAIYFLIFLSFFISNNCGSLSNIIQYVGRYSLIVYIFHPIIQSKTFFTITTLLPNAPKLIVLFPALIAGICIPLLLNWLALERFKFLRFWYYAK